MWTPQAWWDHHLHILECVNAPLFNYFIDFLPINHYETILQVWVLSSPTWGSCLVAGSSNPPDGSKTCRTLQPVFSAEENAGSTSAWPSSTSAGFLSKPESQLNRPAHLQKLQLWATVMIVTVKIGQVVLVVFQHLSNTLREMRH